MFADKFRLLKIIIPLILIGVFIYYAQVQGPLIYPGYREAKEQPGQFIGRKINFGGKILEIKDKYFYVEFEKQPVKIFGKITKDKVNYLITGNALYQPDGSLKVMEFHLSSIRIYKIILSIFPILFIGYVFLKEYKFDKKTRLFIKIKN